MARIKNEVLLKKVGENAMLVPSLPDLQHLCHHILGLGLLANKKIISEFVNESDRQDDDFEIEDIEDDFKMQQMMNKKMFKHREQDIVIKATNSVVQISKAIHSQLADANAKDEGIEDDLQL
jgi:hypothetical protein